MTTAITAGVPMRERRASYVQDAVRILYILDRAGTRPPLPGSPPGTYSCVVGQTRLQALDFWVRNPDYLAEELLTEFQNGRMGPDALDRASEILHSEEPVLRRYPMIRWLYGAYEPLDDALSILRTHSFLQIRRQGTVERVQRHDYFLLERGHAAAEGLLADAPELSWYAHRAELVASIAGTRGGNALKLRQKQQREYADAELGSAIAGIRDRVVERLQRLRVA